MISKLRVYVYSQGSYVPLSDGQAMTRLFGLCQSAEANPRGSTTYFTATNKQGETFVFDTEGERAVG